MYFHKEALHVENVIPKNEALKTKGFSDHKQLI